MVEYCMSEIKLLGSNFTRADGHEVVGAYGTRPLN